MSKEISLEEVKKFWPQSAPNINNIKKYVKKYKNEKIVIKYGGNVLIDRNIFDNFIEDINILNKLGLSIVVVHGGGPRIKRELDKSNIQTKFIRGLRVTDKNIIKIIERVLIDFNNDIVSALRKKGSEAISINTKTNNIIDVIPEKEELGFVGIPDKINTDFIENIADKNQVPVVAPLAAKSMPDAVRSRPVAPAFAPAFAPIKAIPAPAFAPSKATSAVCSVVETVL